MAEKRMFYGLKSINDLDVDGIQWLVKGLLLKNGIHMLAGPPATSKSMLSLVLALEGATQDLVLGKYEVKEKLRVMFLDKENSLYRFAVRFKQLVRGHDIQIDFEDKDSNYIIFSDYDNLNLDEEEDLTRVLTRVKEDGINLIIIDSLVRFFNVDENAANGSKLMHRVFKDFLEVGCSVLFIHHFNKSGIARGSSDIGAFCDAVFTLDKVEKKITLNQDRTKGGKSRDCDEMEPLQYEIEAETIDDKVVALRLKYISAEVADKIEIEGNKPIKSKDFYEARDFDKSVVVEMINVIKKYLKENEVVEFKSGILLKYLIQIFNDEKKVRDNFYAKGGALNSLIDEKFLERLEKKGFYKVIGK